MCGSRDVLRPPKENVYPKDLKLILCELHGIESGILIQLSTYTANGGNTQDKVIASFDAILTPGGFHRRAKVRPLNVSDQPRKDMMSLVYARGIEWSAELAELPGRFEEWMRQIPH